MTQKATTRSLPRLSFLGLLVALGLPIIGCNNAKGSSETVAAKPTDKGPAAAAGSMAITETEVTVGQLHSATGTMAISETGSYKPTIGD